MFCNNKIVIKKFDNLIAVISSQEGQKSLSPSLYIEFSLRKIKAKKDVIKICVEM